MKKILLNALSGVALLIATYSSAVKADSWDYQKAYSYSTSFEERPDWMRVIPDHVPILSLALPGTHDSASTLSNTNHNWIAATQRLPISDQLQAGIRYLDFRCNLTGGKLKLFHGIVGLGSTCKAELENVISFLEQHPSEVVFVHVKQEESDYPNLEYGNAFYAMIDQLDQSRIWRRARRSDDNPALGDVRGKIVFSQRFDERRAIALVYKHQYAILDHYEFNSNWDLYEHWEEIKKVMEELASSVHPSAISIVGSGGSFPYFVASGRTSPEGPHLLTGLTTPGWSSSYPDFPRGSCLGTLCSIYFSGLNELVAWYLDNNEFSFKGVVWADFPGPALIQAVIDKNAMLWKSQDSSGDAATSKKGDIYVYNNPYTKTRDYFEARREGPYGYFPTNQTDNDNWKYLGHAFPYKKKLSAHEEYYRSFCTEIYYPEWVPQGRRRAVYENICEPYK
ncbi:hypothetical protein NPS46_04325 [Pseudomonas putida]|uniref:hypothetical protein n=1 Tax=Pseudomonas putida TaxID=303 RepID=UPI002363EB82|nr:hypothetical protein [Pseudomonas putida]MDD2051775.1 hypothetical protein [Pseudomonas putida]